MENQHHPTFGNGKICYLEIPSTDIMVSANFYQKVFGWNIRSDGSGNIAFDDAVGEVSGMWVTGRKPVTEIGCIISIMVDSIAATVELIKSNGGSIIKVEVDSNEKIAWFSDPSGNIFGLYQQ